MQNTVFMSYTSTDTFNVVMSSLVMSGQYMLNLIWFVGVGNCWGMWGVVLTTPMKLDIR